MEMECAMHGVGWISAEGCKKGDDGRGGGVGGRGLVYAYRSGSNL